MGRPASRTKTLRPFSVSSLAAHPPVMPEPTMMASYSVVGILRISPCSVDCFAYSENFFYAPSRLAWAQNAAPFGSGGRSGFAWLAYGNAAVIGARNDDFFEFLSKTDFRGVVTIEREAFESSEEISLKLLVAPLVTGKVRFGDETSNLDRKSTRLN